MLELTVYRVNTINQLLNCAAIIFVDRFNRGVDKQIPVDVYLPGCPPKQEEVLDAITKLRKKVSREIYEEGPNRKFDVLLPIKTIMLDAVLILEITIKDDSINRHLLQRYLLKHFSNTRVQSLPTN